MTPFTILQPHDPPTCLKCETDGIGSLFLDCEKHFLVPSDVYHGNEKQGTFGKHAPFSSYYDNGERKKRISNGHKPFEIVTKGTSLRFLHHLPFYHNQPSRRDFHTNIDTNNREILVYNKYY